MNKDALVELVNKIRNAEGQTEEENDALLDLFLENVPDPEAANYIYEKEYEDLTSEEIVNKALAYKSIQL